MDTISTNKGNPFVGWFEIPVHNLDRARLFYEALFAITLHPHEEELPGAGQRRLAIFPFQPGEGTVGALVHHPGWMAPAPRGQLLYFHSPTGDLTKDVAIARQAGGTILLEPSPLADKRGYIAILEDTEGNRIALFSPLPQFSKKNQPK